jgi:HAD superfamily hydrolase (TIGR01509 family)
MIKLIIFDLDGVLISTKNIHYESLNEALPDQYKIPLRDHLCFYDGLKTNQKLSLLTRDKGLPLELYDSIWRKKQEITLQKIKNLTPANEIISVMDYLVLNGYKIAVCSNSIRKTVFTSLSKLGVIEYMDFIVSNEDVENPKPHPEMYWLAMSKLGFLPEETLIVEDSPTGLLSASRSNANVLRVKNPSEVTILNILKKIKEGEIRKSRSQVVWEDNKLNVLIPMAGAGNRFRQAGYTFPKPLIEIKGKPMIQLVVENLNIEANFIFIVQKEHREKYNLDTLLNIIKPNSKIIEVDGLTEGAACTALVAKKYIDNDKPLFFANSDQFVEWEPSEFMYKMNETNSDGGIVTFTSTHPKWSFAKIDNEGFVTEVAEKNPISETATVGYYYWKKGSDFVKYAEKMIEKNVRVNGEFYVCPVFNEAIEEGKKIITYNASEMWGLGTPEDLENFIKNI